MDLFLISPCPYLATAALAALTGAYVWTRPHRPGTRSFGLLAGLWLVWSLAAALQVVVQTYLLRYGLFVLVGCLAIMEPVLLWMIALEYTGNEKWLARRSLILLFVPPLLIALGFIFWPNVLSKVEVHAGVQVILGSTLAKWIFASFSNLMVLLTLGLLINCLLHSPAFRVPLLLLILGRIVPAVGYMALIPQHIPVSPVQATILFLGFTMLLYLVALYSFRILQVIPVARDTVIARLPYALIVLDAENRLVDFNAVVRKLPGMPARLSLHQAAKQELTGWWERLEPLIGPEPVSQDLPVSTSCGGQIFHTTSLPLLQASGRRIGQAFLLEDVTRERQVEQQHEQAQQALAMLWEREHLARELHDSLGQVLGYTTLRMEAIRQLLAGGKLAAADEQLLTLEHTVAEAHADVREYILNLRTAPADQRAFFSALRQYLDGFLNNYGIQSDLTIGPGVDEEIFTPDTQMQVFRIIQEAFSNARKHAQTDRVRISFERENHRVYVRIQDQGCGFNLQQAAAQKDQNFGQGHFGLRFMRERAEKIGGSLRVDSQLGEGTCVEIEVPISSRS